MFAVGGAAWCAAAGVCKRAVAGVRRLRARWLARGGWRGALGRAGWARVGFGAQERAAAVRTSASCTKG